MSIVTNVLFVCSGNTCRSPMAACLFNALCRQAGQQELQALSAGLGADSGMAASDGARHAMAKRCLSLENHRSRPVTKELLGKVDAVIGVSKSHLSILKARYPHLNVPMYSFDPPIPDPYGGPDELYEQTAQAMEPQIAAFFSLLTAQPQ